MTGPAPRPERAADADRLPAIKAWWATFDGDRWQDANTEPLVQARVDIDHLVARVEKLERLLKRLEWAGTMLDVNGVQQHACPSCTHREHYGHADFCELAAALREAP